MKTSIKHIQASDLRATYYGDNGKLDIIKTARSHAAWWKHNRLPYAIYRWQYRLMYARYVLLYWKLPNIA